MPIQTTLYCVKGTTSIAKLALEYKKVQELSILNQELERQKYISESILAYSHMIRDDVQSLMHMHFKSAYENLQYALNASAENQNDYLRQARNKFVDATTIEMNENLILSYIGLSFCQAMTNDIQNSGQTLNKIKGVYCTLPDDYDVLESMLLGHENWNKFLSFYMIQRRMGNNTQQSCEYAFSILYPFIERYYYDIPQGLKRRLEEELQCHKRHIEALASCGGFSYDVEEFINNDTRAIKLILQEDFESFKTKIISLFEIK